MRGAASGRATALSLACASTDTSRGINDVEIPLPPRLPRCTQRCQRCTTGFCNDAWGHQDNLHICSSCYDLYLEAGHILPGCQADGHCEDAENDRSPPSAGHSHAEGHTSNKHHGIAHPLLPLLTDVPALAAEAARLALQQWVNAWENWRLDSARVDELNRSEFLGRQGPKQWAQVPVGHKRTSPCGQVQSPDYSAAERAAATIDAFVERVLQDPNNDQVADHLFLILAEGHSTLEHLRKAIGEDPWHNLVKSLQGVLHWMQGVTSKPQHAYARAAATLRKVQSTRADNRANTDKDRMDSLFPMEQAWPTSSPANKGPQSWSG